MVRHSLRGFMENYEKYEINYTTIYLKTQYICKCIYSK